MSNIIDSIQLSGVTYSIQGSGGGNPTVELTQAEYDALVESGAVQTNTYYIITDAQAGDLTQYWTSAQTQSAITSAVSTKQDQLVSGTNIKTINNESILGSGNIEIQGGGITSGEVQTMINDSVPQERLNLIEGLAKTGGGLDVFIWTSGSTGTSSKYVYFAKINEKSIIGNNGFPTNNLSLVETSAITSSVTSTSTDSEIPTAKAVYDKLSEKADTSAVTESITEATSGKLDTSTFETYSGATATEIGNKLATSDFNTYSGAVDTAINSKASESDLSGLTDVVSAHTANTTIHVTTAQTASWDAKSNFSGSYNDLTDKPTIPTVPTSNTAFTNDAGYITSDAISGKADTSAVTESINAAVSGKVDTSAITTSVTSASTDAQVPSAKAVYDKLGGLSLVKLTQAAYDNLSTYDSNTLYVIVN